MQFRTMPPVPDYPFELDYNRRSVFAGSCFTEHIGGRMQAVKFPVVVNPFGILYNPVSVKNALNSIILKLDFREHELIFYKGLWHSLMHHGDFSHPDKDACLANINETLADAEKFLQKADVLFITFGTSWIYEYKTTGEVAGNCHKIPANEFNKRLLNADEITIEYYQLLNDLQNYNPDLKIVFSISPVRHLKDGFNENTLSKSVLHIAVNQIKEHFDNVFYFPAYELMNDDLRDYRFYADDLIHPANAASDYIFKFFSEAFFTDDTKERMHEVENITKAAAHRILHPGTPENSAFAQTMLNKIEAQSARTPNLNFDNEKQHFLQLLSNS